MNPLNAILLGLLQGITEFLPISSSGHLSLARLIFSIQEAPGTFDVFLHGGSLLAVLVYFRHRFKQLTTRQLIFLGTASVPAGIAGIAIEPIFEQVFQTPWIVILGWFITGTFLLVSEKRLANSSSTMTSKKAGLIGLFQALAITPGISRSGSTITAALLVGLDRQTAFNFSFYLSIPAVAGALLLEARHLSFDQVPPTSLFLGIFTAFLSGLLALGLLEKAVVRGKLYYFSLYCYLLAIIAFLLFYPLHLA